MLVGRYEVLGEIGRGGMGVVYRARSPEGREVAVKVLLRADKAAKERFARERRLLASLGETEGFVPVLDAGEHEQGSYIVMPLLAGGTLRDRLRRGPLPVAEAVSLVSRIARGVGAAHERGIVHRDLKPENILFTTAGAPLVADLGLAKHWSRAAPGASQSVSLSATGEIRGTAGYMAPEQARDAKEVGPTADVFALGAILYELISGRAAFPGESVLDVIEKVQSGSFAPLHSIRPETPRWLEEVVSRALAREPARRFSDGGALARALVSPPRRRRVLLPLAGIAATGAIGLSILLVAGRRRAVEARALAARADARVEARDFDGAIADATRAIELDPRSALAWTIRGAARSWKGDVDGSLADASRAVELDPRSARAWTQRGIARRKKGSVQDAFDDESKAIELDPTFVDAWVERAAARGARQDLDGVIADESKAIELDPRRVVAWADRALARRRKGDLDGAIADASRAIELDPQRPLAWDTRAVARSMKRDHQGALADWSRLIELRPDDSFAWAHRGGERLELGDAEGAMADAERAIGLDPRNAAAWGNRGAARERRGDFDGALADANRAIELKPGDAHLWSNRAVLRGEMRDAAGAIADASRAIELDPKDADAWLVRGAARGLQGDADGAIADATRGIELQPRNAMAYANRAWARDANGDREGAIADFERSLELEPRSSSSGQLRAKLDELRASRR